MAKLKFSAFIAIFLVLTAAVSFAVLTDATWENNSNSITVLKGDLTYFDFAIFSMNPPISYSIIMYDEDGNALTTIDSGTINSEFYSNLYYVLPTLGGSYSIIINAKDQIGDLHYSTLALNVINFAPFISGIPDVNMECDESYSFDLDNYVSDPDDLLSDLIWSVSGNSNINVAIDSSTHVVTLSVSGCWTGSEVLTFTVSDPSGDSDSQLVNVNVLSPGSLEEEKEEKISLNDISIEYAGDGFLKIRNSGSKLEDVKLKIKIEADNAPLNSFNFDIQPSSVEYKLLNTEDLSGDYIAKITLEVEDSKKSGYMILEL